MPVAPVLGCLPSGESNPSLEQSGATLPMQIFYKYMYIYDLLRVPAAPVLGCLPSGGSYPSLETDRRHSAFRDIFNTCLHIFYSICCPSFRFSNYMGCTHYCLVRHTFSNTIVLIIT